MIVNIKNILITLFFLISANIIKSVKDEAKVDEAKDKKAKDDTEDLFKEIDIKEEKNEIKKEDLEELLKKNGLKKGEIKPDIKDEKIYKQKGDIIGFEKELKKNSDEKPGGEINVNQNIIPVEYKAKVKEKNSSCCNF